MSTAADGAEHHGTLDAPTSDWWDRFADDASSGDRAAAGTSRAAAGDGLTAASTAPRGHSWHPAPGAHGDGDVQAAFVAWKGPQLVRLARTLLRDEHQAEDIVQDVLATALSKWARIKTLDDPSAYLNRMLVNAVISSRLRPWRREEAIDPAALPERATGDGTDSHAERQRCLALLRQLPDKQRIAIVLRLYEGLPDAEIADLMDCSTVTVRSNAHRGLATLRRLLSEEGITRA